MSCGGTPPPPSSDETRFYLRSPASGKLTVARALAALTGYRLFHNHLVVDVFPFPSERFVRLRETFWLSMFREAGEAGQSIVFTFCPEPTVAPDFADRVRNTIESVRGELLLVRLTLATQEQERRIANADRGEFGKLRSVDLLRQIQRELSECEAAMPPAALTIDTALLEPHAAAEMIANAFRLPFDNTPAQPEA